MSIFSQWRNGVIGWPEAAKQGVAYIQAFVNKSPALQTVAAAEVAVFKQAASNAIAMADTAAAPLINTSAAVVSAEMKTLLTAYLGPVGAVVLTPATSDAINLARDALIAEIHAVALQFKADLAVTPAVAKAA
jgi:hypothetical protein